MNSSKRPGIVYASWRTFRSGTVGAFDHTNISVLKYGRNKAFTGLRILCIRYYCRLLTAVYGSISTGNLCQVTPIRP
ncbi:MAG: hypothetical protein ACYSUC_09240, partial [Planctomycetota bacterium]